MMSLAKINYITLLQNMQRVLFFYTSLVYCYYFTTYCSTVTLYFIKLKFWTAQGNLTDLHWVVWKWITGTRKHIPLYLAVTIELIVFSSCGLSSKSLVLTLLVTYRDKRECQQFTATSEWLSLEIEAFKNLAISNDNQNMVLSTSSLHYIYCSIYYWPVRRWPLNIKGHNQDDPIDVV